MRNAINGYYTAINTANTVNMAVPIRLLESNPEDEQLNFFKFLYKHAKYKRT